MKQRIYNILIVIIVAFICVNIYNFYKDNKKRENVEVPVSSDLMEQNILNSEASSEDKKPIDSNISDWNLILVNKDNPIPENYRIETINIEDTYKIDARAKDAAKQMLEDARKEGLYPIICSAYRSFNNQKLLFNNKVKQYRAKGYSQESAEEQASYWVTIPGTSEHELGLALDIVSANYQILDENQEKTEVQKWLMEHCYEYGFILRYPTEKKDITKINYEPWHYRYVGIKDAMVIKEKGFCLEEYIDFLKSVTIQ